MKRRGLIPNDYIHVSTSAAKKSDRSWEYINRSQIHECRNWETVHHKVHIYKEYHSVCPLAGIGTLPPPLSPASVPLPPEPKGGAHPPAGEGLGESHFRRLEKSLALFLLCAVHNNSVLDITRPPSFIFVNT
jgi:hypothetical protein